MNILIGILGWIGGVMVLSLVGAFLFGFLKFDHNDVAVLVKPDFLAQPPYG